MLLGIHRKLMFPIVLVYLLLQSKLFDGQFYHKDVAVIYDDESFLKTHSAFIDVLKGKDY